MSAEGMHGNDFLQRPLTDSRQAAENLKVRFQARPLLARHSDLDLDFGENSRPEVITRLLSACLYRNGGTAFADHEIWRWSLKDRLQGLLAIVVATREPHLKLQFNCSQTDCHEPMEFELDLLQFVQEEQSIPLLCKPDPETELEMRLPNGLDQLNWISNLDAATDNLFAEMALSLISRVNGEIPSQNFRVPENWLDSIGTALEQHDDLMILEINTRCPVCTQDISIDLDLEEKLLNILATEQKQLLKQIHKIALAYHWPEADIVAIPNKRRRYYLARIDEEWVS